MARGKDSRGLLKASIDKWKRESDDRHVHVKKKRERRKAMAKESKPEVSDFDVPKEKVFQKISLTGEDLSIRPKPGQTGSDVVNWYHVQRWFVDKILQVNADWLVVQPDDRWDSTTQTMWAWREKGCAERLLKHYGPEIVKKTVEWFCDNWQGIKDASNGKLGGAPSVRLLWVARERFFAEANEGKAYKPGLSSKWKKKRKHMVGEYDADADSKMPDIGWGDV